MNYLVDQLFRLADNALSDDKTNDICLLSFTQSVNESAIPTYL